MAKEADPTGNKPNQEFAALKPDLILRLRNMAMKGASACDMIVAINDSHRGNQQLQILTIAYFRKAFGLPLRDLMPIGAWSFFDGGTWSREEVENYIMPLIESAREQWIHFDDV